MMHLFKSACKNSFSIICRRLHIDKILKQHEPLKHNRREEGLDKLIETHIDKILFNTHLYKTHPKFNFRKRVEHLMQEKEKTLQLQNDQPLPRTLRYFYDDPLEEKEPPRKSPETVFPQTHFPFASQTVSVSDSEDATASLSDLDIADSAKLEVDMRHSHWMHDYENYEDDLNLTDGDWRINYGTPDPHSVISSIPCGGCGALLHCKDTAIPGYLPSEIFNNAKRREGVHLRALTCQRCHFLKYYNLALQVRVSSDDYVKVLDSIKMKRALILLTIDLFDFPCSLWPGIVDVLGEKQPIVIVGNKVDLLPQDSASYLNRVKDVLLTMVQETVSWKVGRNVKHVALISAKTGWGVEELITKLHTIWGTRGDVYVVGCTNVGKSSLFNCLLQSDFCKVKAVDLIQRATTSIWPGTTMNMLKFPILRPSGWRMYVRTKRLQEMNKIRAAENQWKIRQLKETRQPKYATLVGHIDRTFRPETAESEPLDPFIVAGHANSLGKPNMGINENDPAYVASKWCYDTPGVEHPEQIIHLLTTEELTLTLPRELIRPKTFSIRNGQSIFIAGVARLDYCEGPHSIRVTVFCSDQLPITMCSTVDANDLYEAFLGTEIFLVPKGSADRLSRWPKLQQGQLPIILRGESEDVSCGDIVLSSAGWISITCTSEVTFQAWTPEGRGIYVRKSLLPFAVTLRGKRVRHTPTYGSDKLFLPK